MAVLIAGEAPGMTVEQYDQVNEVLGISSAADVEGLICHTAGVTEGGGLYASDVWESNEACERFINDRLIPEFEQLGIVGRTQPTVVQVHNHMHE
ncbi:MAG: hypothetical protein C5B48_00850 [Candidatus Rokuibacteriota bacterium]|nr:MAG: hypothetical protein C5B48_00850 [Candidatus Rokubacteria bacterium]